MAYSNTTSITGGDPFGQLTNAFSMVRNMFSPNQNVFGGGAGFAQEPSVGDPLTNAQRSATNLLGTGGANLLTGGQNLVNMGTGVMGGGLSALMQPLALTSGLMSGDPTLTTQMLAPQMANAAAMETGALGQARQGAVGPAGGYSSLVQANLPQALAAQGGNAALALMPWAAQTQAGLGGQIAGIGNQMGGLGTTLTGQGTQALSSDLQNIIDKMRLNAATGPLSAFTQVAQGIGALLGGGGQAARGYASIAGLCWIAEAIYGTDDIRTHLVRAYLNGPFQKNWTGRMVAWFYRRYGKLVAALVRRSKWLKAMFKPLFDRALKSAIVWVTETWKPIYSSE